MAPPLALWRLSLGLAAALICGSIWLAYEVVEEVLAFSAMFRFLGGDGRIEWVNLAGALGTIGMVGVVAPGVYMHRVWRRAFPRFAH